MQQSRAINKLLQEASFQGIDSDGLLTYIAEAIAGREYGSHLLG